MENKRTFYAMVLGALAVAVAVGSIATVSFASAQTPSNEAVRAKIVALNGTAVPDVLFQKFAAIPDIKGSVNAGSDLMSKVQVSFSDAAKTAADSANGSVVGGSLTIEQSYLVYSFRVLSGDQIKTVIVDAGNGQVLYTSEGFPADVMSEISGHGNFFTPGVKAFTVMAKTPGEEAGQ
ncbi:MAG: PepSY domain-containing protein [Nitrososphaera sp.]|jgi:uncharacterized membrane protein YkoI